MTIDWDTDWDTDGDTDGDTDSDDQHDRAGDAARDAARDASRGIDRAAGHDIQRGDAEPAGDLDTLILGAPPQYTRPELAARSGLTAAVSRRYWRALGFADVSDDAVAFTESDVRALLLVRRLLAELPVTEDDVVRVIRAVGQATARLAESYAEEISEWQRRQEGDGPARDALRRLLEQLVSVGLPALDDLVSYALRRQLAAAIGPALTDAAERAQVTMAVGFADLVSFTRLSRRLEMRELAGLVETFESIAADVVGVRHGRLVKTLGDEVLFVAERPDDAAEIGLGLMERVGVQPQMPELRVGMAHGEVLTRKGDVFGPTVNLASRLASVAAPGTIVVDRRLAESLQRHPAYRLSRMRRRPVRGLGLVEASRLRRAQLPRSRGSR